MYSDLLNLWKYIIKMESNESEEVDIKNHTCYYFDDIIKIEDNILIKF